MRSRFDMQLGELNTSMLEFASMVERAIAQAAKALEDSDEKQAKEVIKNDEEINNKEKEIERQCLMLLLQQQPVAGDLRLISSALKMITDMERIADQAADICELVIILARQNIASDYGPIMKMSEATQKMVTNSINAYVNKDLDLAYKVIKSDDEVDQLLMQIKSNLIEEIRKDLDTGEQAMDYLMIAKYFERIGDHAENIAEWVVFSITGRHVQERD